VGNSVTKNSWSAMNKSLSPSNKARETLSEFRSPAEELLTLLTESEALWNDPFLLPCALLLDHYGRMNVFCGTVLTEKVMDIERELGVTVVGREIQPNESSRLAEKLLDRPKAMDMTARINTQYTIVLFSRRSPKWSRKACQFLLDVRSEMSTLYRSHERDGDSQVLELLESLIIVIESLDDHVSTLQARMDLQLNVVRKSQVGLRIRAHTYFSSSTVS
jgi:hypothetical protein